MATKIFIAIMIIIYTLFFLSVFGPMHSRKKFWRAIYKIRDGMDFISYWIFNICGIGTILVLIHYAFTQIIKR